MFTLLPGKRLLLLNTVSAKIALTQRRKFCSRLFKVEAMCKEFLQVQYEGSIKV